MEQKKTDNANVDNRKATFGFLGLVAALAGVLILISWTSFDVNEIDNSMVELDLMEEEIIPQNQVAPPPPPPPPPAPTTVIEIVEDDEEIEEELEIEDFEVDDDTEVEIIEDFGEEEVEEEQLDFFKLEDKPCFPSCSSLPKAERGDCTQQEIIKYVVGNVKYPPLAKDAGISGTVFVGFVIQKDGSIDDVEVLRGVHPDLDKEALRAIKSLPKFIPGKQRGKPVNVPYSLPILFQVQD